MTPEEIKGFCEANGIRFVDVKFVDLFGLWQHITRPIHELNDWTDCRALALAQRLRLRWLVHPRLPEDRGVGHAPRPRPGDRDSSTRSSSRRRSRSIANVEDPVTREPYTRDARYIAQKAEQYVKDTGVGDTVYIGPELEFFIFDEVRFGSDQHSAFYSVDSDEGIWNSGAESTLRGDLNPGYRPRYKEGYFPVSPHDTQTDIRNEMVEIMEACGIQIELHHHEVATAGQGEIDMRFDTLTKMGDKAHALQVHRQERRQAPRQGRDVHAEAALPGQRLGHAHATCDLEERHQPLRRRGLRAAQRRCACAYIAGLIKHGKALMAICAPTTNSYKRLVPGYEAPVNLVYSARNRSAACRIPLVSPDPRQKRVEFRPPDPAGNPYLTFAAILMAGMDGIQNGWDPGPPLDKTNLFDLSPEELANIPTVAQSLDGSLQALEDDHDFLLKGGVFTPDVIETWIA